MSVPDGESVLERLYEESLKDVPKGAEVPDVTKLVVRIPVKTVKSCSLPSHRVYITARALKHIHERHENDFKFVANNIWAALKHPNAVYQNIDGKRGKYLFVKIMRGRDHFACAVEVKKNAFEDEPALFIATVFRNSRGNYFKKCKPLWSRKAGNPSS